MKSGIHCIALMIIGSSAPTGANAVPDEEANHGLAPGLVATFKDDARSVAEVVELAELGLAEAESPHPAIKPAFTATYQGFIEIQQPGRYRFHTDGTLTIGGKAAAGGLELAAGQQPLELTFQRPAGEVRFGLSWESEHFVREPVPPTAFRHSPDKAPATVASASPERDNDFPSPPHRIRQALEAMNCASCHNRNFLATMHHKYNPDSLSALMRHVNPPKWYGASTGPQLEENDLLARLAADLRKLPGGDRTRGEPTATPNNARVMVGAVGGYACIACHDAVGYRTAAESKGANLAYVTDRVSYDWFVRWMNNPGRLQPGVAMPPFFIGQDPDQRQQSINALWDYLAQGEHMELPDELDSDPNQFILKPDDKPLFTRTYIVLADGRELLRAICVGLPNGVSYCFDAETCQLVYVWTGGFLNMAPHWENQSGMPTPAIGNPFHLAAPEEGLRIGAHQPVFRGYQMIDGIPRFEFTLGDTIIRLLVDAPEPDRVRLSFRISGRDEAIDFIAPPAGAAVEMTSSIGTWTENHLTIAEPGEVDFVLTLEPKQ